MVAANSDVRSLHVMDWVLYLGSCIDHSCNVDLIISSLFRYPADETVITHLEMSTSISVLQWPTILQEHNTVLKLILVLKLINNATCKL